MEQPPKSAYTQRPSRGSGYIPPASGQRSALFGSGGKPQQTASAKPLDYAVGDKVKHRKFGVGTVIGAQSMGKDVLLKISFEVGEKNLLAAYAPIEKI